MFQNITQIVENKLIFLKISNREKREQSGILATPANSEGKQWHYLKAKKLSALLRGITSKHHGDFYCMNCLHYFATKKKKKLELHKKVCENKDFYNVIMPFEDAKILECNPCQNCDKAPSVI